MNAKQFISQHKFLKEEPMNVPESEWLKLMTEFAKIKCDEQFDSILNLDLHENVKRQIKNAPKPDFE